MQESNSFARDCSRLSDFDIATGDRFLEIARGTNTEAGGAIEELGRLGHDVLPLLYAYDAAAGPVDDAAFEVLSASLLDSIGSNRCDALLIALHGAWLSPLFWSCDAELMRRVRGKIGPSTPLVVTLDYHANVRPKLLENVHGLVGYRTYPHVDMGETGKRAARLLHRIVSERLSPVSYWLPIPLIAPPQRATTDDPLISSVFTELDELLRSDRVLSSSFFCVQPWLDVPEVATSLVVVAKEECQHIISRMHDVAASLWAGRDRLNVNWLTPEKLIASVKSETRRPVIVSEAYDGTSGGSIGDHPGLLRLLLPHREELKAAIFVVDAEVAIQSRSLGQGKTLSAAIGAKTDDRFGSPVTLDATIEKVTDGKWTLKGPVSTGRQAEMGTTVVLRTGQLRIVVASKPEVMFDPELYRSQGIVLEQQDVIGVKSPAMYRAAFKELGGVAIDLDMAGVCRGNLKKCPFNKIGWPIYPLDDFVWNAAQQEVFVSNPQKRRTLCR
jgi:microcystin degradation protein MlrC